MGIVVFDQLLVIRIFVDKVLEGDPVGSFFVGIGFGSRDNGNEARPVDVKKNSFAVFFVGIYVNYFHFGLFRDYRGLMIACLLLCDIFRLLGW